MFVMGPGQRQDEICQQAIKADDRGGDGQRKSQFHMGGQMHFNRLAKWECVRQFDPGSKLIKPGAAEAFQIVLALGVQPDRHLAGDPGERNIGLRTAKLLQCGLGDIVAPRHAGGGRQHPVGADEIAAQPDALARKPHRLVVVAADVLGIGDDAVKNRRERIARAQPQRAARGQVGFFPAPAIRQREAVIALRQREVRD